MLQINNYSVVDKQEFLAIIREAHIADTEPHSQPEMDVFNVLFEDLTETERARTPLQIWNQEINFYQTMPRLEGKGNPLDWWKFNQKQLPNLSKMLFHTLFNDHD